MRLWKVLGVLVVFVVVIYFFDNKPMSNDTQRVASSDVAPMAEEATFVDPRLIVSDPTKYKGQNILAQGYLAAVRQNDGYTGIDLLATYGGRAH